MIKDLKFINGGKKLDFDVNGFAINPENETAIAFTGDFRDIVLTLVGTGNVVVYGSAQRLPPDFTAPSTIINSYTPIALVDYSLVGASAFFPGATGGTVSGDTKLFECDTNLLSWIAIQRSIETVEVLLTETNAQ